MKNARNDVIYKSDFPTNDTCVKEFNKFITEYMTNNIFAHSGPYTRNISITEYYTYKYMFTKCHVESLITSIRYDTTRDIYAAVKINSIETELNSPNPEKKYSIILVMYQIQLPCGDGSFPHKIYLPIKSFFSLNMFFICEAIFARSIYSSKYI